MWFAKVSLAAVERVNGWCMLVNTFLTAKERRLLQ